MRLDKVPLERFFQFGFPDVIQNLESGYECSIMMVGGCLFHAVALGNFVCVLMLMMVGHLLVSVMCKFV